MDTDRRRSIILDFVHNNATGRAILLHSSVLLPPLLLFGR